jgi:hypothetical protein
MGLDEMIAALGDAIYNLHKAGFGAEFIKRRVDMDLLVLGAIDKALAQGVNEEIMKQEINHATDAYIAGVVSLREIEKNLHTALGVT